MKPIVAKRRTVALTQSRLLKYPWHYIATNDLITLTASRLRKFKHQSGFTLIELVLVILLIGILAGIGGLMFQAGFNAYIASSESTTGNREARFALERIARELRATYRNSFITASNNQIKFTDNQGDTIFYFQTGTQLFRQKNVETAKLLADNLQTSTGFALSYLKNDGATTATALADVYYITIAITTDLPATGASILSTTVFHRNP